MNKQRLIDAFELNRPQTPMTKDEIFAAMNLILSKDPKIHSDVNKMNKSSELYKYFEPLLKGFQMQIFLIKDWLITELSKTEIHFSHSSSVDHFFMDGADELYNEAHLVVGNDKARLSYDSKDYDNDYFQLYVPKGTQPTWEELKKICE